MRWLVTLYEDTQNQSIATRVFTIEASDEGGLLAQLLEKLRFPTYRIEIQRVDHLATATR
jgi:hypothetical protein